MYKDLSYLSAPLPLDIQRLIDPDVGSSGNPDHRANSSNICSTNQVRKGLKGGSSVLHIQQNEVISGAAGSFHKSGIRSDHEGAQRTLLRIHGSFKAQNTVHRGHAILIH